MFKRFSAWLKQTFSLETNPCDNCGEPLGSNKKCPTCKVAHDASMQDYGL